MSFGTSDFFLGLLGAVQGWIVDVVSFIEMFGAWVTLFGIVVTFKAIVGLVLKNSLIRLGTSGIVVALKADGWVGGVEGGSVVVGSVLKSSTSRLRTT